RGLGKVPRLADLIRQKAEEAAARRAPAAPPPDPDGGAGGVERRVGSSVFGLRATVARGMTRGIPCLVFLRSYRSLTFKDPPVWIPDLPSFCCLALQDCRLQLPPGDPTRALPHPSASALAIE